jgi:replicative DNA helicase
MVERNPTLKVGIFSKEMTSMSLMKKLISKICKIPVNLVFSQKYDKEFVKAKMMEIEPWRNNRIRIIDPSVFHGVGDIARIQTAHRFDIWFLDFIQLLEFSKSVGTASDYNIQIGQNMRNLLSLSLTTKSVGIILSQVRKGIEKNTRYKCPTISDIEWSGLIKQLSAYIFFSYYPIKYYGERKISKNHYYLIGEKTRFADGFTYPMFADPELGNFAEIKGSQYKREMLDELYKLLDG